MFRLCDLDPQVKSIHHSVEEIDRLCTAYKYICEKHPEIVNYNFRGSNKILPATMTRNLKVEAVNMWNKLLNNKYLLLKI